MHASSLCHSLDCQGFSTLHQFIHVSNALRSRSVGPIRSSGVDAYPNRPHGRAVAPFSPPPPPPPPLPFPDPACSAPQLDKLPLPRIQTITIQAGFEYVKSTVLSAIDWFFMDCRRVPSFGPEVDPIVQSYIKGVEVTGPPSWLGSGSLTHSFL